jgi:serine phosphatase RsbU (regulator of sigma subunit)
MASSILTLIRLVTDGVTDPPNADLERRAYLASEVFACEATCIIDAVFNEPCALDTLFTFT